MRSYGYIMTSIASEKFLAWMWWTNSKTSSFKKKMPGKPRKLRKKEHHEVRSNRRLVRKGRVMTCQLYFRKEHNKSKYPIRKEVVSSQQKCMDTQKAKVWQLQIIISFIFWFVYYIFCQNTHKQKSVWCRLYIIMLLKSGLKVQAKKLRGCRSYLWKKNKCSKKIKANI